MPLTHAQMRSLAEQEGLSSFYLLDLDALEQNYRRLRDAFVDTYASTQLAYSFKTNYTPAICSALKQLGCWAEVVSELEYDIATKTVGFDAASTLVNGPVHEPSFVRRVLLDGALFNLDAWYLLDVAAQVCRDYPQREFRVGVRLTFPIEEGGFSRFGIESSPENLDRLAAWQQALGNCRIAGFHSHYSNSSRSLTSFRSRVEGLLSASAAFFGPDRPELINIGGGFLGEMPASLAHQYGETPPTFEDYAAQVADAVRRAYPDAGGPMLLAEPGTAIVANTMVFVCRVLEVKNLGGRRLALIDGSKNNVKFKKQGETLPIEIVREPDASTRSSPADEAPTFDVVGNTCIEKDVLCSSVPGTIASGDYIVFQYAGGYSHVLKQPFIHPCQPIYATQKGTTRLVKRKETVEDILATYL